MTDGRSAEVFGKEAAYRRKLPDCFGRQNEGEDDIKRSLHPIDLFFYRKRPLNWLIAGFLGYC